MSYWGQKDDPLEGKRGFFGNLWDNVGDLYRGLKHYGINRDAWATDPAAQEALGGTARTVGYGAALYGGLGLLGGGSAVAGAGKLISNPVTKWVGNNILTPAIKSATPTLGAQMAQNAGSNPGANVATPGLTKEEAESMFKQYKTDTESSLAALLAANQRNQYRSGGSLRYGGSFGYGR